MSAINVRVEHAHVVHRFTLLRTSGKPHYPTFTQLCEALIHHLKLKATIAQLASHHPPIHVWYLDGDGNVRLCNNSSVREALRKTPKTLRLRLKYRRTRASKSETSAATHPPSRTSVTSDEPYQPSPTTLLKLLNHAENHASDETQHAFEDLRQSMLKYSGDAANLAAARHRLARLFCAFLRRLANTPVDKVPDTLEAPLLSRLESILEDEDISEETIRAARRAARILLGDRQALIHLRTKWAVLSARSGRTAPPTTAPPSSKSSKGKTPERPIKHYQNHVQKLVEVGGGDVKETYRRLMKYANKHKSFDKAKPGVSRDLCKAVEKIVFHVVRCHRKDGKFVIQSHAARALAASVGRKFGRAGFDKRFVTRVSNVTRAMVDDPAVVELAYGWAKKRSEREASAVEGDSGKIGRLAEEDDDELFGGKRDVDESDSTTTSTTTTTSSLSDDDGNGGGSRRSRSASRRSRSASRGSRTGSKKSSLSGSKGGSKRSRSASGSRAGSKGRGGSRSADEVAEEEVSRRSRSRSRASSRRSGRSESRASLRSLEEDADEVMRSRRSSQERLTRKQRIAAMEFSSESSSDDEGKIYRYDNVGIDEGSSLSSEDTSKSQWARVEMEKEKERLRRMYEEDRDLFSARGGSAQVDVSKRLRHARDSIGRQSLRDVPTSSQGGSSITSDEPARRVGSMRSGRSPQSRRKSKSPFRKNLLWFREVGSREGVVS